MELNPTNSDHQADDLSEPGSHKPGSKESKSFFRDLLTRRVPHILGGYLAASWIILEFMDWLEKRYPISPYLDEFVFVTLAAMVPTVILLAYFHGKPGRDHWTRVEKIGIPINVVITAMLLIFLFNGQKLGAITTTVTIADEHGQEIERSIPKSEFRKKVAIFSMENETGDTAYEWMMHAIPDMIKLDLIQDIYLDIKSSYDLYNHIRYEGYPDAVGIPLVMKKKIAGFYYMNYFLTGYIHKKDDQLSIHLNLHETRTTKSMAEGTFTGNHIPEMVDEISLWIKEELSIPKIHLANTVDLPTSEIITNSPQALKTFYAGMNECYIKEKWDSGILLFEESVKQDTMFAYAYFHALNAYINNTRSDKAMQTFEPLMKYRYKLPERMKFEVKKDYYFTLKKDPDMAMKVTKSWIELYPEDVNAYASLAEQYYNRMQREKAIETYNKILDLDPGQYDCLLYIADIYLEQGKTEEALRYANLYTDKAPGEAATYNVLGRIFSFFGKPEQARTFYEKALAIDPNDIFTMISLAEIKTEMGDFNSALNVYEEIVGKCDTPQDLVLAYQGLENYYFLRGEVSKAIDYLELRLAEQEQYDTRINLLYSKYGSVERYILAGKVNSAFDIAREMENLGPPHDIMIPRTYLKIYLELEQAKEIEQYVELVEANIDTTQFELLRPLTFWARGKLLEIRGDYKSAIQHYSKALEAYPDNPGMDFHIGRCYRMNKEYRKAEEHFQNIIDIHPYWPEELYEFGLVYFEWGKYDKALEYFNRAQGVWENADPEYKPAAMLREKLAELEAS